MNPRGALGLELKPDFSIAIDKDIYPIGIPFIIEYLKNGKRKLAISHDTGSAIKGYNRADLFTGNSSDSEKIAGRLKKQIYLYALIPYSN
jgi:membrane-bound lytic murein transglycosylase A